MQHEKPPSSGSVNGLIAASRALVGVAVRSLGDVDNVTLVQFRALVVVSTRPRTTVSDLAETLDIHPTTATRLCDRLVAKRLLRRVPSSDDRRTTELHLAAAGRRLVKKVTARRRQDLAVIVERMPEGGAVRVESALRAFAEAAGEIDPGTDIFGWDEPA